MQFKLHVTESEHLSTFQILVRVASVLRLTDHTRCFNSLQMPLPQTQEEINFFPNHSYPLNSSHKTTPVTKILISSECYKTNSELHTTAQSLLHFLILFEYALGF
jgi:hypothetical protein